ncbi:MAG TPA: carboxypeptidase-like regulatory domain-containing protein [Terriglobales bacterium]|nr:carboxypeptidase-like regulatory domain-containing protein [Terriglobales bacterium]
MHQITRNWFAFALLLSGPAFAQITSQSGAITGTVSDQTGASVPNAKVTLTSGTGVATTQSTGTTGEFTFPLLAPGNYALNVEAPGFSKATVSNIVVNVTQTTSVPVTLELGTATVEVNVAAVATLVNATNATLVFCLI